jgi:calcineurin-like phosphoesterase family protein
MNYYIGDPHFFHFNIMKYDNRPFASAREMNEAIIKNWKERVKDDDTVYIIGDVSWDEYFEHNAAIFDQLPGKKVLIRGNHDKPMNSMRKYFTEVCDYKEIVDNGTKVILFHYPILFWNGQFRDSVHLYAHVHNSHQWNIMENTLAEVRALQAIPMRAYNVGCMMSYMDYGPRTLKEIIDANEIKVNDH